MNPQRTHGMVLIFLIIGLISLPPICYVVYAGIKHLFELQTIADRAWTIGGIIKLLAFPLAFIVPSLTIIIRARQAYKRGSVYERPNEPQPQPESQPEKPKRDWAIFKVGMGISLVLITIGVVIMLSDREKKAMGIEVEGKVISKRTEGDSKHKRSYFTVEFTIDGNTETHELKSSLLPILRRNVKLYVSKDTYASVFDDGDDRHWVLHYQNKNLIWIIFMFGCAAFIIFVVSALTFSDDVETKNTDDTDATISYMAGMD